MKAGEAAEKGEEDGRARATIMVVIGLKLTVVVRGGFRQGKRSVVVNGGGGVGGFNGVCGDSVLKSQE